VTLQVYVTRKPNIHYKFNALFKKKVKSRFYSMLLPINSVCTNLRHVQKVVHAIQAPNKKKPSSTYEAEREQPHVKKERRATTDSTIE
jgi:hypothetical protein